MADERLTADAVTAIRARVAAARATWTTRPPNQAERLALETTLICQDIPALCDSLAAVEGEHAALRTTIRDLLWIVHHGELRGAEGMAMIHGFGYSPQFLAETTRKRQAAERLVGWEPSDGR